MTDKVKERESRFVDEYLIDMNGVRSARAAGYRGTDKSIGVTATRLLAKPRIKEAIQKANEERKKRTQFNADRVLKELEFIATFDPAECYDENGQLLPIHEMPERARRAIASIDIYKDFTEGVEVGETKRVRSHDKNKALDLAGRHFRMFTNKIEHSISGELAERLAKARKRVKGEE